MLITSLKGHEQKSLFNTTPLGGGDTGFSEVLSYQRNQGAPYSFLADADNTITYNGVTFICDNQSRALCLGDMSNKNNVITIPLAEGGCLKVNRDNLGDLAKAIGMFSPEDVNRILNAIALDAKVRKEQNEVEEKEMRFWKNMIK